MSVDRFFWGGFQSEGPSEAGPEPRSVTTKLLPLAAVPPGVVTATRPVVAPAGTVAVIFDDELITKVALVPLKVTAVAPVKLLPLIVTLVPTGPLIGDKLET